MSGLEFAASLIGSLAWPVATIALVVLLRKPLSDVLLKLRAVKYGDFQADFGDKLSEAEETIAKSPAAVQESPVDLTNDLGIGIDRQPHLQRVAPNLAVIDSWLRVEKELGRVARNLEYRGSSVIPVMVRFLHDRGVIDSFVVGTIDNMRQLRNAAVHNASHEISVEEARRYASVAETVLAVLRAGSRRPASGDHIA